MPRTTTVDCAGCPPLRALTFDVLGLVKVTESRSKQGGVPKVVDRWGEPDSSKGVLAASIDDSKLNPLLAIARKGGKIEVLNPLNGDLCVAISNAGDASPQHENDAIVGLHLFRKQRADLASRSCTLLTCTAKGNAVMRSIELSDSPTESACDSSSTTLNVSSSGSIFCSKVDGSENYGLFGGKRVEVNMWDLEKCVKIWTAKSPPKNSLGIFTPTCFTSAAFLSKDDHRKFVAGTYSHEVRLYDMSAQRRPVISFNFWETPIKAVTEDGDGHTIYIGNGSGDLASVDIRTGKLLGCFLGKCSGSIRSIARHPEFPVLASCGLDSYLRFWDIKTRQLLSSVFLKQHLTSVVFDTNFVDEEIGVSEANVPLNEAQNLEGIQTEEEEETLPVKKKKSSKFEEGSRKRAAMEHEGTKKLKSKRKSRHLRGEIIDDDSD